MKYASTLVGTAGQKNGRIERYMMEALMSTPIGGRRDYNES